MRAFAEQSEGVEVKENRVVRYPVGGGALAAGAALVAAAWLAAAALDRLPPPRPASARPDQFSAERAMHHLINLTDIGPRVAGSYENEVLAKSRIIESLGHVARAASPHNKVEWDVFAADGGFSLSFFDGLNSVYRGVRSVVARVRPAGAAPGPAAPGAAGRRGVALLLNCHTDTVPDSPGASDDGAGCAVMLEAARALAAGPPLRAPLLLLFNAAEENIMQGSHAFVTNHPWAASARAFINLEACGAGGREVLFQSGPRHPWLLQLYASRAPHPFGSSVAQELFESGLIPADTDFRVFRDFGKLSGLDFAWSSNGWVYHTALDDVSRIPAAALQRTGDNVLALLRGAQEWDAADEEAQDTSAPLYFDVGGVVMVLLAPRTAALLAAALLLLLPARLALDARLARTQVRGAQWARLVAAAAGAAAAGGAAGAAAGAAAGLLLHAAGAPLRYYSREWLLLPLFALPAAAAQALAARAVFERAAAGAGGAGGRARLAAVARAGAAGAAALPAALLAAALPLRLRSGLLPALWVLAQLPPLLLAAAEAARGRAAGGGALAAAAALGAAPALLVGAGVARGALQLLLPLLGRAGTALPLPDAALGALVGAGTAALCSWLLPLVLLVRMPRHFARAAAALWAAGAAAALLGAPYCAQRPQRLMLFHTARTLHPGNSTEYFYWIPHLDANTPAHAAQYAAGLRGAAWAGAGGAECARWPYCGAPYYLPVAGLVAGGHVLPAPAAPPARLHARLQLRPGRGPRERELAAELSGAAHVMVVLAPAAGVRVRRCDGVAGALREAAPWGARRTYFLLLHRAAPALPPVRLRCVLRAEGAPPPPAARWLDVSAAAHALGRKAPAHRALEAALPADVAPTGWAVDLHLYSL